VNQTIAEFTTRTGKPEETNRVPGGRTASEMEFSGSMGAKNPQATCPPKRVRAGGSDPPAEWFLIV